MEVRDNFLPFILSERFAMPVLDVLDFRKVLSFEGFSNDHLRLVIGVPALF
jgi:hypothetical protein